MKIFRYLVVAIESIVAHKLRAGLTMLGMIIGVTAVLTTMGIGSGAAASITERIQSQGTNLLTVSSTGRGGQGAQTLTSGDAKVLADKSAHPDFVAVVPEYEGNTTLSFSSLSSREPDSRHHCRLRQGPQPDGGGRQFHERRSGQHRS